MFWLAVLLVAGYFAYTILRQREDTAKALQESRRDEFDGRLDRMGDVCQIQYKEEQGDWKSYADADFERMMLDVTLLTPDPYERRYELFRTRDGEWYQRLKSTAYDALTIEERITSAIEDDLVLQLAPGEELERRVKRAAEVQVKGWERVEADLGPWLESGYQRCVDFFGSNPGLYPSMGYDVYVNRQYDPTRVWTPPQHSSPQDFEAWQKLVQEVMAALRSVYDEAYIPDEFRSFDERTKRRWHDVPQDQAEALRAKTSECEDELVELRRKRHDEGTRKLEEAMSKLASVRRDRE